MKSIKETSERVLRDMSSNSNDHVGREKRRLAIISQKLELDREHFELDSKGVAEEREELKKSMSEEKESSMDMMKGLNAEAFALESEIEALRRELAEKETNLKEVNDQREQNQRLMDEVDQRFAETLTDLQTREREVTRNLSDMEEETKQLEAMSNELEASQKNAADELKQKELNVKHTEREWKAVGAAHSGLSEIYQVKSEHMMIDEAESKSIHQFASDVDIFSQANQLMEQQKIDIEAKIEEYRSSLESIDSKVPTLEGQKKRAVASKNFKQCKSIVAEIKTLTEAKTEHEKNLELSRNELNTLIGDMNAKVEEMEEKQTQLEERSAEVQKNMLERARIVRGMLRKTKRRLVIAKCDMTISGVELIESWQWSTQSDINRLKSVLGFEDGEETEEEIVEDAEDQMDVADAAENMEEVKVEVEGAADGADEYVAADQNPQRTRLSTVDVLMPGSGSATVEAPTTEAMTSADTVVEDTDVVVEDTDVVVEDTDAVVEDTDTGDTTTDAEITDTTTTDGASTQEITEAPSLQPVSGFSFLGGISSEIAQDDNADNAEVHVDEEEDHAVADADAAAEEEAAAAEEEAAAAEEEAAAAEAEAAAAAAERAQRQQQMSDLEASISDKEAAVSAAVEVDDYDLAEEAENERQGLMKQLEELRMEMEEYH